jgi:hypothetical protein
MTLVEADLYTAISKTELDGYAQTLVESGQADPVETAIAEALAVIKLYVDPYKLADGALAKLWKTLAVCWIYNRVGTIPAKREKEEAWAMKMLEDIRDGLHANLIVDEEIATAPLSRYGGPAYVPITL